MTDPDPKSKDKAVKKKTESATKETAAQIVEPKASRAKSLFSSKKLETLQEDDTFVLPVIPIREGVLFPSTESVLTFGRKSSIESIRASKYTQNQVVLVTQKDPSTDRPKLNDVYQVGTLAVVERTLKADDQINALVRGVSRVKVKSFVKTVPHITAQVEHLHEIQHQDEEIKALATHLQKEFRKAVHMGKPVEFLNFMKLMSGVNDGELVDQIASTLTLETEEKQDVLETLDIKIRLQKVIDYLAKELKVLEIEKDVASKTQEKFDKHMRESVLRERLKTIQKELGELDDEEEILTDYQKRLKRTKMPAEVKDKVEKEIKRLRQMSPNNPEAGYVRSWLDTIFELPWSKESTNEISLNEAAAVLDENHYGLEKVKDRILEYIAVLQLKQSQAETKTSKKDKKTLKERRLPTILCFVGPPGVGKTSIGRSIAESLGREFVKISLGGIRDEAEIRGHRRTYVGAMPGRIISGMKQAGTINPVFMLDEIDKIGQDFRGDPSAALLEALDPEQNDHFEDHYLDVPFDLSHVIFITTANTLDTIPSALRDRLEIIRYSGYTEDEKFNIAKNHLMEKLYQVNGLDPKQVIIPDEQILTVIQRYTREAGVRDLERTLSKVMRKAARKLLESTQNKKAETGSATKKIFKISPSKLQEFLGPEKFDPSLAEEKDQVGLATGLAWTQVGGDVLFIEIALTPGKGVIKLTGKLGEVMKESAQAAVTYVKANSQELGISSDRLSKTDIHIHIPEGAVPKDGPSAGITITTAIVSAFTNIPIRRTVAMTGEVTLRGRVLRIGGLKEKSIAAHRAGCKVVIIPAENERDLVDVPTTVKKEITFKPVSMVDEAIKLALTKPINQKKAGRAKTSLK